MKHTFIISILFSALAVLPDSAYAQQLPANAVAGSYMEQAANHIEWRTDHIEQAELCCMKQADSHGVQDVEAAVTGGALMRNRHGDMVDSKAWRQHRALKATAWTSLGLGIASLAGGVLWKAEECQCRVGSGGRRCGTYSRQHTALLHSAS